MGEGKEKQSQPKNSSSSSSSSSCHWLCDVCELLVTLLLLSSFPVDDDSLVSSS
ncbi:unnamed protein product, partial [Musa banksii]